MATACRRREGGDKGRRGSEGKEIVRKEIKKVKMQKEEERDGERVQEEREM